jgi:hypothetical protein
MAIAGFALPLLWFPYAVLPWHFWPALVFAFALFPVLGIVLLIKMGYLKDLHVYERKQRNRSYALAIVGSALGLLYLYLLPQTQTPYMLFAIKWAQAMNISLILIWFVNGFALKASAHMMGVGGFLALCFVLYHGSYPSGPWIVNALILCALVYAARKGLSAHSHIELISGFGLGFLTTFVFLSL